VVLYNMIMQKLHKTSPALQAVTIGFVFLIPLIVLEIVNRWEFNEGFPLAVFAFTWALQSLFVLIITPLVKSGMAGKSLKKNPVNSLVRVAGLVLIAYIWVGWIGDQWPCLMGVPNCD
jgi:hypothetical protein